MTDSDGPEVDAPGAAHDDAPGLASGEPGVAATPGAADGNNGSESAVDDSAPGPADAVGATASSGAPTEVVGTCHGPADAAHDDVPGSSDDDDFGDDGALGPRPAGRGNAGYRPIVSFQPRGGRMNDVQKRAWDAHADEWLIERSAFGPVPAPGMPPDPSKPAWRPGINQIALFGRVAPLVIEIGPGMGDATAAMARARPDINLLAIEVYKPGIAQTFSHLARAGVDNVRVLRADAAEVLRNVVIPDSLAELWLFFPDPWRKRKHHKRRIVTPAFAGLAASCLLPGGSWYLATDWEHYAKQMLAVVSGCAALENPYADAGGWAPRAPFRPETRFERRGLGAERAIFDLHVVRKPTA